MLGLDGSGKTAILYRVKTGELVGTSTTVGFNLEYFAVRGLNVCVWDIGYKGCVRPLWRHYLVNTQALIYVVDCSDSDRIEQSSRELQELLSKESLKSAVLLVYANKQDVEGAAGPQELERILQLNPGTGKVWKVQGCSAKTGSGVQEGFDWLCEQLTTA